MGGTVDETTEETIEELTEAEKRYKLEEKNMHYIRRFMYDSSVMRRRVTPDQIALVTPTLVKRKNISKIQILRHYH